MPQALTLDPTDPFDGALIPIVEMNRRKRRDYARDGDPFSNFRETSEALGLDGFGPLEAALFNCLQKMVRLRALRANGRMAQAANETVDDTYLDLAVYAVLLYGLSIENDEPEDDYPGLHDPGETKLPFVPAPTTAPTTTPLVTPPATWAPAPFWAPGGHIPAPPWTITCHAAETAAEPTT